ncbi:MAG: hypothetical protein AAGA18_02405 [Verrucomicrobiota bacterium]
MITAFKLFREYRSKLGSKKGSFLILVLWAMAFLTFLSIELMQQVSVDIDIESAKEKNFRALQLAEMGLAFGLHPDIEDDDPLLKQEINNIESFDVLRTTEESKLNINELLKEANNKQGPQKLRGIFSEWGMSSSEIDELIDKLLDWIDEGDLTRLNGAEADEYINAGLRRTPRNLLFQTVDEMQHVMGIGVLNEYQPNWPDFFTVYGSGQLDISEANAETISSFLSINISDAESFIIIRDGNDGIPKTDDDYDFEDIEDAMNSLGLSRADERERVGQLITLDGSVKRIVSTGKISALDSDEGFSFYERKITVIMQGGGQGQSNNASPGSNPSRTRGSSNSQFIKWQIE